jgi:hypothetical protein
MAMTKAELESYVNQLVTLHGSPQAPPGTPAHLAMSWEAGAHAMALRFAALIKATMPTRTEPVLPPLTIARITEIHAAEEPK